MEQGRLRSVVAVLAQAVAVLGAIGAFLALAAAYLERTFDEAVSKRMRLAVPGIVLEQLDDPRAELGQRLDERMSRSLEVFATAPRQSGPPQGFANDGAWGRWSDPKFCPIGHYVCGLNQAVEPFQGGGLGDDDTAMNAVAFFCCPFAVGGAEPPSTR